MQITKYPQACIMIETNGYKMLIDPGNMLYTPQIQQEWNKADIVFVTHYHPDHAYSEAIRTINKPTYSTKELKSKYSELDINIIQEGDTVRVENVLHAPKGTTTSTRVEVVRAIHGFITKENEIKENVGFIVDDGQTRLYITGDSLRFDSGYKADVVCANVCAFDASTNLWGAIQTTRDVGASKLIVVHQDGGRMFYTSEQMVEFLDKEGLPYLIPTNGTTISI